MTKFITAKDYLNDLSRRARRFRIESSITQQELADATGVSLRTIQNFENGKDIQMSSFLKILIALGLNEQFRIWKTDLLLITSKNMENRKNGLVNEEARKYISLSGEMNRESKCSGIPLGNKNWCINSDGFESLRFV